MKDERIIKSMMNTPDIRNLGLREEVIASIVERYNNIVMNELISNGYIYLDSGLNLEVVQLTERVHVLRGVPYHSNRKYKLKATMNENLYEDIESYYDKLMKEIE